jgi:DNA helicase HerA-like ATPase
MEDMLYSGTIKHKSWEEVKRDIYKGWKPKVSPHHSIVCITGGGKSYLYTRGLLPMRGWRKAVIIDIKGDDETLEDVGKAVRVLPDKERWATPRQRREPDHQWYRLVVHDDWGRAREQVQRAFEQIYRQGNWTVFVDETRHLTDPRPPSLNLRNYLEHLWLKGRSRGIEVVGATQAPRWVPSSFYDQPSYVWIGRINDERAHQRLREIGGLKRGHLGVIQSLQKRQFLVVGDGGDYTAITKVPDLSKESR